MSLCLQQNNDYNQNNDFSHQVGESLPLSLYLHENEMENKVNMAEASSGKKVSNVKMPYFKNIQGSPQNALFSKNIRMIVLYNKLGNRLNYREILRE